MVPVCRPLFRSSTVHNLTYYETIAVDSSFIIIIYKIAGGENKTETVRAYNTTHTPSTNEGAWLAVFE